MLKTPMMLTQSSNAQIKESAMNQPENVLAFQITKELLVKDQYAQINAVMQVFALHKSNLL
jgi:hypothetical protein